MSGHSLAFNHELSLRCDHLIDDDLDVLAVKVLHHYWERQQCVLQRDTVDHVNVVNNAFVGAAVVTDLIEADYKVRYALSILSSPSFSNVRTVSEEYPGLTSMRFFTSLSEVVFPSAFKIYLMYVTSLKHPCMNSSSVQSRTI